MLRSRYIIVLVMLCLCFNLSSCVDDVDFEQGEAFTFYQNNTISLVFFEVDDLDFTNPVNNGYVIDVTRLDFLDDGFIQENLVALELYIEYNNTFSQDFNTTLTFLSEADEEKYPIIRFKPAIKSITLPYSASWSPLTNTCISGQI